MLNYTNYAVHVAYAAHDMLLGLLPMLLLLLTLGLLRLKQ